MKTTLKLLSLTLVLLFTSCSGLQVASETASNADLKKYNSYSVADTEEGFLPEVSPTQKMQIEQAISKQAQELSTVPNNSGVTGPDVLVNYFVVIDSKKDFDTYTTYYGRRRWHYQVVDVDVREYTEGTLIIDFIDEKTKEVIWHGSTTSTITPNSVKLEGKINEAVKAIFDKYKSDQLL